MPVAILARHCSASNEEIAEGTHLLAVLHCADTVAAEVLEQDLNTVHASRGWLRIGRWGVPSPSKPGNGVAIQAKFRARGGRHSFSMRKANECEPTRIAPLASGLARADAHRIQPEEHEEQPELTAGMLSRTIANKGGRPRVDNPRKLISLRLPADVIERWKANGPDRQTRMAERMAQIR